MKMNSLFCRFISDETWEFTNPKFHKLKNLCFFTFIFQLQNFNFKVKLLKYNNQITTRR